MKTMYELTLPGLDGTNPLAFLAALGVLAATHDTGGEARLKWEYDGTWRPVLSSAHADHASLIRMLDTDRQGCAHDAALTLEYNGKRDLKPPPSLCRTWLGQLVAEASPHQRRSVDWASAFVTDVAVDNNGNIKPSALHFTAGQQQFLQMARELVDKVTEDDLREAISGPWQYAKPLPVMGWDNTASRDYALRASNPSTDTKLGVPGADWLAIRGLSFVPTAPSGQRVLTTACDGGWKDGAFRWPLWTVPLSAAVVRSLLRADYVRFTRGERQARGLGAVFGSGIKRHANGGRGSFEPATAI
jgi:hypothetical protein